MIMLSMKFTTGVLLALIAMSALPVSARQAGSERVPVARSRVAPPVTLACERNQLTSFSGEIIDYQRGENSTHIRIKTDWDTVESLILEHAEADDPASYFRVFGQAFTASDWARIEIQPGVLIKGMRVIAWVCLDGKTPLVIDWRPSSKVQ